MTTPTSRIEPPSSPSTTTENKNTNHHQSDFPTITTTTIEKDEGGEIQQKDTNTTSTTSKSNENDENSDDIRKDKNDYMHNVILPHLALICVPILASVNMSLARAAFSIYDKDKGEEPLEPFVLAILRTVIASLIYFAIKQSGWFVTKNKNDNEEDNNNSSNDDGEEMEEKQRKEKNVVANLKLGDPLSSQANFLDFFHIFLLGIVGISLNFIFLLEGISRTNGITTAAMFTLVPSLTFFIGWLIGTEAITLMRILATILVWGGNVFMARLWRLFHHEENTTTSNDDNSANYFIGLLFLTMNIISFSSYLVFSKPILDKKRFNIVDFNFYFQISGLLGLLFISLFNREHVVMNQILGGKLNTIAYVSILYSGAVQSVVTYFFLTVGISKCSSLFASLLNSSQPVLIVMESILFLGETMNFYQQIGSGILLFGVCFSIYVSVSEKKEKKK